ncbi:arginine repressor, partial [Bifidobacteriaceae bacterium NR021]
FNVTQATLSRDLDELNAVKIRLTDGRIAYVLGDGTGNRHAMDTVRIDQQVA